MQEKLIKYLLGELGPDEAAEVERRAADDPAFARQLEHLRACFESAAAIDADRDAEDTPAGLADRTADSVTILASQLSGESTDAPASRCSFSPLEAVVAIGVVVAVAMMLVPALGQSRDMARRTACEQHMNEVGAALLAYANDHGGYFPMPPAKANAGSFAVTLADDHYADRQQLAENVVCPGSPEADQVARGELSVRVPTAGELNAARGELLAMLRRVMSLSLAYRSPYLQNGKFKPIHNDNNHRAPLLSDAPVIADGQWRNVNHGCGLNVLFEDGSVKYLVDCREPVCRDHFFVNAAGQPAPPTTADDAVLLRSETVLRVVPIKFRVRARLRISPASPAPAAPLSSPTTEI